MCHLAFSAPAIPNLGSLKKLSLGDILEILSFVSHMVAGDPDVPGDSGMLGDDVMNYELPSIGKTVK